MDPVKPDGNHEEKDNLWEEGDEVEAQVVILYSEVEHVEIHTEVMANIFPRDVVEVRMLQELLSVHIVEGQGEGGQGQDGAGHQPQPRRVNLEH